MELKIAEFEYTKASGKTTHRKLLVISRPSDTYFGIEVDNDLTEVRPYLEYLNEMSFVQEEMRAKYGIDDLELNYKRFKLSKITALQEAKIEVDVDLL